MIETLTFETLADNPLLEMAFYPRKSEIWPPFMQEDATANRVWRDMTGNYPEFTFYLVDCEGEPVACGHAIPITWDGTLDGLPVGWDTGLLRGVENVQAGIPPNTLQAIEISIRPDYVGYGLSQCMIDFMRQRALEHGFQALLAPVRPNFKSRYPLMPMEQYIWLTRDDGLPFDPWMRTHWRAGAEILKVADPSMRVEGSVADWEEWADMRFPVSGVYVVEGALAPIQIDREANVGLYIEPNVWMHHPLTTSYLKRDSAETCSFEEAPVLALAM